MHQLATADLAAFGSLKRQLTMAYPILLFALNDASPLAAMVDFSASDLVKALTAAASRGLGVVTPLFSRIANCSSVSCLHTHLDALGCLRSCLSLCRVAFTM